MSRPPLLRSIRKRERLTQLWSVIMKRLSDMVSTCWGFSLSACRMHRVASSSGMSGMFWILVLNTCSSALRWGLCHMGSSWWPFAAWPLGWEYRDGQGEESPRGAPEGLRRMETYEEEDAL